MAVAFHAVNTGTGDPCTINDPGSAGEFLIAGIFCVGVPTLSPPSTWVNLYNDNTGGFNRDFNMAIYYKASATGSGNYQFGTNKSTNFGFIAAYSGVTGTAPDSNSHNLVGGSAEPWTIASSSITTNAANCMAIWIAIVTVDSGGGGETDVFTAPSGYTSRLQSTDHGVEVGVGVADFIYTSAGATGTVSGTDTRNGHVGNASKTGYLIALAPAGAAATSDVPQIIVRRYTNSLIVL